MKVSTGLLRKCKTADRQFTEDFDRNLRDVRPLIDCLIGHRMPRAPLHTDWTEHEIGHLRRLVAKGYPISRISRRLGRANETVIKKATECGITLPTPLKRRPPRDVSHGQPR